MTNERNTLLILFLHRYCQTMSVGSQTELSGEADAGDCDFTAGRQRRGHLPAPVRHRHAGRWSHRQRENSDHLKIVF